MAKKKTNASPRERTRLPLKTITIVLTEAGYRCAVPTCRGILALDMHHIWEVCAGGGDTPSNLIALCPTCHNLYHRGTISAESIYAYKAILVALTSAFDVNAVDKLLFLNKIPDRSIAISGDGVLQFAQLIATDLVEFQLVARNGPLFTYTVTLPQKGRLLIDGWLRGDRESIKTALNDRIPDVADLLDEPQLVVPPVDPTQ